MAKNQFMSGLAFRPKDPPGWLLEEMRKYKDTGVISTKLLEASAPFLNKKAEGPPRAKAFPGHIK